MTSGRHLNTPISTSPGANENTTAGLNMCDSVPVCVSVFVCEHLCVYIYDMYMCVEVILLCLLGRLFHQQWCWGHWFR